MGFTRNGTFQIALELLMENMWCYKLHHALDHYFTIIRAHLVLLALVDANYQFCAIDVGAFRRNSDGGVFSSSP